MPIIAKRQPLHRPSTQSPPPLATIFIFNIIVDKAHYSNTSENTCDSLHVTNLASDVVSIAAVHANTSFEVTLCIYLAVLYYIGHAFGS